MNKLLFVTSSGPPKLDLGNAVIIAVRIYARPKLGKMNFVYLEVAAIVVANEYRRPLGHYNGAARGNKFVCN